MISPQELRRHVENPRDSADVSLWPSCSQRTATVCLPKAPIEIRHPTVEGGRDEMRRLNGPRKAEPWELIAI